MNLPMDALASISSYLWISSTLILSSSVCKLIFYYFFTFGTPFFLFLFFTGSLPCHHLTLVLFLIFFKLESILFYLGSFVESVIIVFFSIWGIFPFIEAFINCFKFMRTLPVICYVEIMKFFANIFSLG